MTTTSARYREKECARMALAMILRVPFTADVTKEPEADLLMLESATCQAVLAREVEGSIVFDLFEAVGDYTVFIVKHEHFERTFGVVGYLSNDEGEGIPFWLVGRVSLEDLSPIGELIDAGVVSRPAPPDSL